MGIAATSARRRPRSSGGTARASESLREGARTTLALEELAALERRGRLRLPGPTERREQIVHPSDERALLVPEIPEQADRPAGAKHARDLRQRELGVEPVEGLPGGDDVHPTRRDRNPLRRTLQRLDAR